MSSTAIAEVLENHGITCEITPADSNPHMREGGFPMHHWQVVISDRDDRSMTVPFSTGEAIGEPTGADVLECLISDAEGVRDGQSFEEWADELGFNPDSRADERVYRAVVTQTRRLRLLLSNAAYEQLREARD